MDWGKGILITIIAFVILMVSMVAICVKQDDIHLVTQNYYEEEIKYQDQINKMINANSLETEIMSLNSAQKLIQLNLPVGAAGTLHLFRPSDARLDKVVPFEIKNDSERFLDLSELKAGYWRVKLTWTDNGVAYYKEEKINI